ncbi:MAG: hypothetical protein IPN92_07140 [Chromatiaceae bacterium]|nr:hypothetical protein [Chromatiaceae bacterium]
MTEVRLGYGRPLPPPDDLAAALLEVLDSGDALLEDLSLCQLPAGLASVRTDSGTLIRHGVRWRRAADRLLVCLDREALGGPIHG